MRRFLCLIAFLLTLILPCVAEEAASMPAWAVGEWKAVLTFNGAQIKTQPSESEPPLVVTEDGILTFAAEGAPQMPLIYDADADEWYISPPETENKIMLYRNWYLEMLILGIDAKHLTYYVRTDAEPEALPYRQPAVSYGGDWSVWSFYTWSGVWIDLSYDYFSNIVNMDPILTITLPPFPTIEAIQQIWAEAVSQAADDCPLRALQVSGFELRNEHTLLLITQHGLLELNRRSIPQTDPTLKAKLDGLTGVWYPDELSVGGIELPVSAMNIPEDPIAIDEQGNVLLADGTVTALRLEEETLYLGEYPLSGYLTLTLADGVELDFISEADWYRRQLNGDWQLSRVSVPSLSIDQPVDAAVTDVTLNIDSGDWCYMDSDRYRLYDTSYDVTEYQLYPLYGGDRLTLAIVDFDTVQVTSDSGSYILTFTRIEEIEETEDE